MAKQSIIGLGNALVDVVAPVDHDVIDRHALRPGGMHLVMADQAEALMRDVRPSVAQSGGSVANSIAHVGTAGRPAAFIGKVARDPLGKVFTDDMARIGVATPAAMPEIGPGTGHCVVLVTPDGERTMSTYLGAAVTLEPSDTERADWAGSAALLIEGYLWDSPDGAAVIAAATKQARAAGARVAMTPSDAGCVERNLDRMRRFVAEECDILIGNEDEMGALSGTADPDTALAWAQGHTETAVITLSERGSLASHKGAVARAPAKPVADVVDTTGAGDAYVAGFLDALIESGDVAEAADAGACFAARVITHFGARRMPEETTGNLALEAR